MVLPRSGAHTTRRARLASGLLGLALTTACGSQAAPPEVPPPVVEQPPPVEPQLTPWPRITEVGAHLVVVERLRTGAHLPSVPTDYATATQQQALARAKNLTQRLSLRQSDVRLGQTLAKLYAENLFPDRAMAVLGMCLAAEPTNPVTLKLTAASLNAAGEFHDSIALFEELTRVTPTDQGLAGPLFRAYWELGELDAAHQALQRGLEIAPFNPHLELALGRVLFEEGDAEAAAPHFERAATNLPSDTEAWYRLATCLAELGREEPAAAAGAHHSRLIQMEEFGIPNALPEGQRRRALVAALETSGDLGGAERERAALVADGLELE